MEGVDWFAAILLGVTLWLFITPHDNPKEKTFRVVVHYFNEGKWETIEGFCTEDKINDKSHDLSTQVMINYPNATNIYANVFKN